ncbi:MAG TPA: MBOAT family O-acyltransferase, partial [Thermoanaerobaculia bacterium]
SSLANFGFGLWVERARDGGGGRGVVACAVAVNLALLVFFKYADWLWASLGIGLQQLGLLERPWAPIGSHFGADSPWRAILLEPDDSIRLPIGISFFTFQALSYVIDVHRRTAPVQKNPLHVVLYVALFPQLIAGPIVRYKDVAEQIVRRTITRPGFAYGIRRFVIGLGKKVLIADLCAKAADSICGGGALSRIPGEELTPELAWLAAAAFMLQVYYDFSGYSDMAVGLGHMFGFRFMENFDYPYTARSITEFWQRWNISLSTWFRDYVYVPLGGNRRGMARSHANLLIVAALCGLWHGANATFLVFGLWHGTFLVLERMFLGAWLAQRPGFLRHVYTLLVVMGSIVFFRSDTVVHALDSLKAMVGLIDGGQLVQLGELRVTARELHPLALHADLLTWLALGAGVIGAVPWLPRLRVFLERRAAAGAIGSYVAVQWIGLLLLGVLFAHVAMALASGGYTPFIYFRF